MQTFGPAASSREVKIRVPSLFGFVYFSKRTLPQSKRALQGSLHYTPEHCLVNGGFPLFWWKKPSFKWATCICKEPTRDVANHSESGAGCRIASVNSVVGVPFGALFGSKRVRKGTGAPGGFSMFSELRSQHEILAAPIGQRLGLGPRLLRVAPKRQRPCERPKGQWPRLPRSTRSGKKRSDELWGLQRAWLGSPS